VALSVAAIPAHAGVPDVARSFFIPQATVSGVTVDGTNARQYFRACPNNDGGASLFNDARLKVFVIDVNNQPIAGIAAADICVLFNGGIAAQGFSGIGADSIIANSTYNNGAGAAALCPDVRCLTADAPTDAAGTTTITFAGADPLVPGVTLRNANRKWGHYDSELPVFVLGYKLSGKLTSGGTLGEYTLQIKNFDTFGSPTTNLNEGELVDQQDFNVIANNINSTNALSFWRDLDWNGFVDGNDFNIVSNHTPHTCESPKP
jgi:hypothetical protein